MHERVVERRRRRHARLGRTRKRRPTRDAVPSTPPDPAPTPSSPAHTPHTAYAAAAAAVVRRRELGRGADGPDLERAVRGPAREEDAFGGAAAEAGGGGGSGVGAIAAAAASEGGARGGGQHADGPDGVGVALERGFGVDAAALPDADAAVLAGGEDPAVALGAAAGGEVGGCGAGGEGGDDAFVAAVGEIGLDVEVALAAGRLWRRMAGLLLLLTAAGKVAVVRRRDDPSFDHAVVASGAYLGLGRTAASGEDDATYDIQVTSETKSDFEILRIWFCGMRGRVASLVTATAS